MQNNSQPLRNAKPLGTDLYHPPFWHPVRLGSGETGKNDGDPEMSELDTLKRMARQLKRELDIPHHQALDVAAQRMGFSNYAHAQRCFDAAAVPCNPAWMTEIQAALIQHGDKGYMVASGPMSELLSKFALQDELEAISVALSAYKRLDGHRYLIDVTPAKILNHFWMRHHGVNASAFLKWTNANPAWAQRIKNVAHNPVLFRRHVVDCLGQMQPHA